MADSIIPKDLTYLKEFTRREVWRRPTGAEPDPWEVDEAASDPSLEEQVREWVDSEHVKIEGFSPLSFSTINSSMSLHECVKSLVVSYLKAVEGETDAG